MTTLHRETFNEALQFNPPAQRCPWLCQITVGRGIPVNKLAHAGLVVFDALWCSSEASAFALLDIEH